jgi:hypothetical protein
MEIIVIMGWLVSGVIGGVLGERKDRRGEGVVLGILLGPIGWLAMLCGKDERRTCYACAEPIKNAAKFCPHCGRQQPERKPEPPTRTQAPQKLGRKEIIGWAIVVAFILALMLGYAFIVNPTQSCNSPAKDTWTPRTSQEAYAARLDDMMKKAGVNQ